MKYMEKKHNGEIALFKFLFALMVFFHHFYVRRLLTENPRFFTFSFGHIAVEFFFIVSGFLMAKKALKGGSNCVQDTACFLKKKIMSLFPFVVVVYVFSLVLYILQNGFSLSSFVYSLPNLFLVNMTGVDYLRMPGMAPLWYVSAMLIGMLILFPLIYKYGKRFIYLVIPVVVAFIYGYIIFKHGKSLSDIYDYEFGFIRCGVLRAIGGMGIGSFVFLFSEKISKIKLSRIKKILLTIIEYACLLLPFFLVAFSKQNFGVFLVPVLAIGVCLAFSGQSLLGKYLQNKFIFLLEGGSLFIYLFHDVIVYWINYLFGDSIGFYLRMGLALSITLAIAYMMVWVVSKRKATSH